MQRRTFLSASVGVVGVFAGCASEDTILRFRTSSNIGKTREVELEEGDKLALAVKNADGSATVTATVTHTSTNEVLVERKDTSRSWQGEEFVVPATGTYKIHLKSSMGETAHVRLQYVE